jgi:hypothetical protein
MRRVLGLCPRGHNSAVITCRIDLKLGGNVSSDLADKMHFDMTLRSAIRDLFQKMYLGHKPSTRLMPLGHKVRVYGKSKFYETNQKRVLKKINVLRL